MDMSLNISASATLNIRGEYSAPVTRKLEEEEKGRRNFGSGETPIGLALLRDNSDQIRSFGPEEGGEKGKNDRENSRKEEGEIREDPFWKKDQAPDNQEIQRGRSGGEGMKEKEAPDNREIQRERSGGEIEGERKKEKKEQGRRAGVGELIYKNTFLMFEEEEEGARRRSRSESLPRLSGI